MFGKDIVNVTVENIGPCKKLLRIEVDADTVTRELEKTAKLFQREAELPGFRKGKAPANLVRTKFGQRIKTEAEKSLISESYKEALREQQLRPITDPEVEEIEFEEGEPFQYIARVEVAPEFELPQYKGIPVRVEERSVSEEDIDQALDVLRRQQASYEEVSRPVQAGDYAVIDYTGTCEGRPISEIAPNAQSLSEKQNFWVYVAENGQEDPFLPDFSRQLIGAEIGEKRTVQVTFPEELPYSELANKEARFEVEVVGLREARLPEVTEEFAKSYQVESVEQLREGVKQRLEHELADTRNREIRRQIIEHLMSRVQLDLPESLLEEETRSAVYDIVRENQQRGIDQEEIEAKKDDIYSYAANSAQSRVKSRFILARIAEKEGIQVSREELSQYIMAMAQNYQMDPNKLARQLKEREALGSIQEDILIHKTIDMLQNNAHITEVPPQSESSQPQAIET